MDNPVLVIDAPVLDDESIAKVYEFLQSLTFAFDAHYYKQLRRYARSKDSPDGPDYLHGTQVGCPKPPENDSFRSPGNGPRSSGTDTALAAAVAGESTAPDAEDAWSKSRETLSGGFGHPSTQGDQRALNDDINDTDDVDGVDTRTADLFDDHIPF